MRTLLTALVITLVFLPAAPAAEDLTLDDPRVKALSAADVKAQQDAVQQLVEVGAAAVPALVAVVDRGEPADVQTAAQALLRIAGRQWADNQQKEVSTRLATELSGKRSAGTRRHVCRLLSLVGGDECVDPLYKCLLDPDVREMARWALVRISTRRATEALVAGLQITEGDFRVALVDALAERRDVTAVPILQSMVNWKNEPMSRAAIRALSHLPDAAALQTLMRAVEAGKPDAAAALLTLGETFTEAGRTGEALQAFRAIAAIPALTPAEYCRFLHVLSYSDSPADVQTLLAAARNPAKWGKHANHVGGAALQALASVPGTTATDLIAEAMTTASGQMKLDLIHVLSERGSRMTDGAAKALAGAAGADDDSSIRAAAIQAIARANIDSAIRAVLDGLRAPAGPVHDAAERAVYHLTGPSVTKALAEELARSDAPPAARATIALALGHRGDPGMLNNILKASNDSDATVRTAALAAMGRLGGDRAVERLVAVLASQPAPDSATAADALARMPGEPVTARLLDTYSKTSDVQKLSLLRVLGQRRSPEVQALLLAEAGNDSPDVRAAAAAGLSRQADPATQSVLEKLADSGSTEVTREALPGLLAIARKREADAPAEACALYTKVYVIGLSPELALQALDGVARTAGPQDLGLLDLLLPMLGDENQGPPPEVCRAAARLAMQLPDAHREEAMDVLEVTATLLGQDKQVPELVEHLWKLGSDFDPARQAGFVSCWWLAGPFRLRGDKDWNKCHIIDALPDVRTALSIDGKDYPWTRFHSTNPAGPVSLVQALGGGDGLAAYGYAEVTLEAAQRAEMRIGSDDGIVVWVNGKQVAAILEDRALTIDQNRVEVDLVGSVNRILVKPLNTVGNWEFSIRLMDLTGHPLNFQQTTK